MEANPSDGDPHLRSVVSVNGFHVHAMDGDLGHVENFLADDANWDIRYLVIATRKWWPGKHVQLAPYAVNKIDWSEERIKVNVTRDQVKSSPAWDPLAMADKSASSTSIAISDGPGTGGKGRQKKDGCFAKRIKTSPPSEPTDRFSQLYANRLHRSCDWLASGL